MYEPEESDESTSPTMRRMFELEAKFEAGLRNEAEQQSMAAVRAEFSATVLWEQLARRIGSETACSPALAPSAAPSWPAIRSSSSCAPPTGPSA
jgi:hypothetical protein